MKNVLAQDEKNVFPVPGRVEMIVFLVIVAAITSVIVAMAAA